MVKLATQFNYPSVADDSSERSFVHSTNSKTISLADVDFGCRCFVEFSIVFILSLPPRSSIDRIETEAFLKSSMPAHGKVHALGQRSLCFNCQSSFRIVCQLQTSCPTLSLDDIDSFEGA